MIQQMRNNAAVIMWIVIIAFVATIVFAWGMDLAGGRVSHNNIGKINGKEIPINFFEQMVAQQQEKARTEAKGGDLTPAQSRMIPYQVWESEVSRMLQEDVIKTMQIGATADQVFDYIRQNMQAQVSTMPQFQTNGVYDESKFIAFLNDPRSYSDQGLLQLEAQTRTAMVPMQTLEVLLSLQGNPTPCEIAYEYKNQNDKGAFEYAKVNAAGIKVDASEISEASIAQYYKEHAKLFTAANELAELYFVAIPKTPTAADEQALYKELLETRARINNNDSLFKEEAKIGSDDAVSANDSGDLGTVAKGTMVPQFDSAVFSIPLKVVSEPVKTMYGYHLIYVESRETKDGKQTAKVRHILRKITPMPETVDRLSGHVDSLQKLAADKGIRAVTTLGATIDSTGMFQRGQMAQSLSGLSGAGSFTFTHSVGEVSDAMENDAAFYILQVKQKMAKGLLPLAMVKGDITMILADSLRIQKTKKYLESVVAKAPDKNAIAKLSSIDPAVVSGTTDTVSGAKVVPEIGFNNTIIAAALALPVGKVSGVLTTNDAAYIVKPVWQNPVTSIPWTSPAIMQIRQSVMQRSAQKIYYDWALSLKNHAKITSNLSQFYLD